ncbi:MAG: hypothetical protein PUP91_23380 [Rhizonema sp. PD37]|nr:hypothetical protein [Rhizonema sp. PD37]
MQKIVNRKRHLFGVSERSLALIKSAIAVYMEFAEQKVNPQAPL